MAARIAIPKGNRNRRWFSLRNRSQIVVSLATTLLASIAFAADKVVDPRLEGTWKIVRVEGDEFWDDEPHTVHLVFKGQKLIFQEDEGDEPLEIEVRTDSKKSPSHLDLSFTREGERVKGEGERVKEKVNVPGIYAIDKDQLKICFARHDPFALCQLIDDDGPYGPRPDSFKDKEIRCLYAERVKLKEKK